MYHPAYNTVKMSEEINSHHHLHAVVSSVSSNSSL
jgi:hypothetical protein